MPRDITPTQHRIARRQRVLKQGKIVLAGNMSVVDCTIRDISEIGAKIICGDQVAVPNEFRFLTLGDNLIRDAKVIWRRGDHLGIRFTSEARRAPPRKW